MPTNDQAQADKLDTATADGNASATEAQATASDNQPATTDYTAPATEGVAAMDDYMKRLQEALEPAPDGDAASDGDQVGDNRLPPKKTTLHQTTLTKTHFQPRTRRHQAQSSRKKTA